MGRFHAKLEEASADDGAMCGVGVAHKRHRKHKGHKEVRTEKPKDDKTMKTKGHKAMELLVVDAGSEEKSRKRRVAKQVTWRSPLHMEEWTKKPKGVDEAMKPKGDVEATETLVMDAAGLEEADGKRRKTKLVTLRSPPHMEEVLINELIDYMVPKEPLYTFSEFDLDPDHAQILACFKENREYKANVLQQYRTNGYAELCMEVTDDEEEPSSEPVEELTCELVEA
ncbi:unnamed protein product [Urochloa humidicola]